MPKFVDLTGREFGRLVVLERVNNSKNNRSQWRCLCKCGNKPIVVGSYLTNGDTESCGCLFREKCKQWGESRPKGPDSKNWKGGTKNRGSVANAGSLLSGAKLRARNNGYKPPSIKPDELANYIQQHDGLCDCCGTPEDQFVKSFHADHDHETGLFRGLLCVNCNNAIGKYERYGHLWRNYLGK